VLLKTKETVIINVPELDNFSTLKKVSLDAQKCRLIINSKVDNVPRTKIIDFETAELAERAFYRFEGTHYI